MLHARKDYNDMGPAGIDEKIYDDEPVFLLRAQDSCAPDTVQHWCTKAASAGVDPDMIGLASAWAWKMRSWQKDNPDLVKAPDMPKEG